MSGPDKSRVIEEFVSYVDDPKWLPKLVKDRPTTTNFSKYRRCALVGLLEQIEDPKEGKIFLDADLDVAGVRHHAILNIVHDLPVYCYLERLQAIPRTFTPRSGKPYMFGAARASFEYGITRDVPHLLAFERAVTYQGGRKWVVLPFKDPKYRNGLEHTYRDMHYNIIAGSALAERYSAHMEIECGNGTSVDIPLNLQQIREVLRDRDKPEDKDRRPALRHFVSAHRRETSENAAYVREHLRGKIACRWRGWDVTLHPAAYDIDRLSKEPTK